MNTKTIMVVDDDPIFRKLLDSALKDQGYSTIMCTSGEEALDKLTKVPIAAIILDIVLPQMDGLEVLKTIKSQAHYQSIPILMLTSKDSETETVLGLELGADDYLSKPVRYYELAARLKKALNKNATLNKEDRIVSPHGFQIDTSQRSLYINDALVSLTFMEYELLVLLGKNPGIVFTRKQLLDILWGEQQFLETRTVDVHIRRLRKKFEDHDLNPDLIETVRSVGYRLHKGTF